MRLLRELIFADFNSSKVESSLPPDRVSRLFISFPSAVVAVVVVVAAVGIAVGINVQSLDIGRDSLTFSLLKVLRVSPQFLRVVCQYQSNKKDNSIKEMN